MDFLFPYYNLREGLYYQVFLGIILISWLSMGSVLCGSGLFVGIYGVFSLKLVHFFLEVTFDEVIHHLQVGDNRIIVYFRCIFKFLSQVITTPFS